MYENHTVVCMKIIHYREEGDISKEVWLLLYRPFYSKSYCSPFILQKSLAISEKGIIFASPEPAKPLNDAQMCGSFYFYTIAELLVLLD